MRIVTLNCNGIRSAAGKGLFDWLPTVDADVVCLQETKAQEHQLGDGRFRPSGMHCWYYDAMRKGYSGVAAFSKAKPRRVIRGFGVPEFDGEGRYLELQFPRLSVVSLYLPSGSAGPERQASKFRFLDAFLPFLKKLARRSRDCILCGDFNIAHR
jgi:exodeoxyribonuclease-3